MWRRSNRQQALVANAVADIVHDAILFIRTMAYTRKTMCDDVFPNTDYSEQIRELADLCDNLVPGLRPNGPRQPTDALQYTWDSRSEGQQQWIRRSLASHRVRVEDLIETAEDRERTLPT
jgi:hypothetical protein